MDSCTCSTISESNEFGDFVFSRSFPGRHENEVFIAHWSLSEN